MRGVCGRLARAPRPSRDAQGEFSSFPSSADSWCLECAAELQLRDEATHTDAVAIGFLWKCPGREGMAGGSGERFGCATLQSEVR